MDQIQILWRFSEKFWNQCTRRGWGTLRDAQVSSKSRLMIFWQKKTIEVVPRPWGRRISCLLSKCPCPQVRGAPRRRAQSTRPSSSGAQPPWCLSSSLGNLWSQTDALEDKEVKEHLASWHYKGQSWRQPLFLISLWHLGRLQARKIRITCISISIC